MHEFIALLTSCCVICQITDDDCLSSVDLNIKHLLSFLTFYQIVSAWFLLIISELMCVDLFVGMDVDWG